MDGLIVDIEVLSELVKSKVPDVHQHVINLGKDRLITSVVLLTKVYCTHEGQRYNVVLDKEHRRTAVTLEDKKI